VAEVVGAERHLVAVLGGAPPRDRHHAGVVDEQVERPVLREHRVRGLLHGGEEREVHAHDVHLGARDRRLDPRRRLLDPPLVARGQEHAGTGARQRERRLVPDAAVRARHERGPALLRGNVHRRAHSIAAGGRTAAQVRAASRIMYSDAGRKPRRS
jgi:hypothetical protein